MSLARGLFHRFAVGAGLLLASPAAPAHSPFAGPASSQATALLTTALLALFWGAYARGHWRRPPRWGPAATFHATTLLCALTILGPLDDWAATSTAAHMVQHMLLMVVIAPLLVLSRPLPQFTAGFGRAAGTLWRPMLHLVRHPLWCAYLHAAVIWFWHLPYFYMLAVRNPWWHAVEHACFLVSAGIFWWAVLRTSRSNAPWALLALLFTLMHTGFLGAVLTFAQAPLYGEARDLQDQQLAGLVMWVLGAIPYLLASGWVGNRWYAQLVRAARL